MPWRYHPVMATPILVLVAPQDIVNIGSAVRIAKNFGLSQVRLVAPEVFDAWRIEGIAHTTADLIGSGGPAVGVIKGVVATGATDLFPTTLRSKARPNNQ